MRTVVSAAESRKDEGQQQAIKDTDSDYDDDSDDDDSLICREENLGSDVIEMLAMSWREALDGDSSEYRKTLC